MGSAVTERAACQAAAHVEFFAEWMPDWQSEKEIKDVFSIHGNLSLFDLRPFKIFKERSFPFEYTSVHLFA